MIYKYIEEHKKYYPENAARLKEWLESNKDIVSFEPVTLGPIEFRVGMKVTFMNEYNVEFPGHTIFAFSADGKKAYIDSDSYWVPKKIATSIHRE